MNKFEKLKLYEAKQKLAGMVFDFVQDGDKILIVKYYDIPNRLEVIIPDFVDEFMTSLHNDHGKIVGAFYKCKYVEKVIMHSNIKGALKYLFREFNGSLLDLSDFDTSNIKSMTSMFSSVNTYSIIFGDKFDTSNVEYMGEMFNYSKIDVLNLSKFNTSNVKSMKKMFSDFKSVLLDLGDTFDTKHARTIESMFYGSQISTLELGNKFNMTKLAHPSEMFSRCKIDKLNLGSNHNIFSDNDVVRLFKDKIINQIVACNLPQQKIDLLIEKTGIAII